MFLDFNSSLAYYVVGKENGQELEHFFDCVDKKYFKVVGSFIELLPATAERLLEASKECCVYETGEILLFSNKLFPRIAEILSIPSEEVLDVKEGLISLKNNTYILLKNCE